MSWEDTVPEEGQEALREWKAQKRWIHPSDPAFEGPDCPKCRDSGELPDGSICPDCCPHDEHDHGICLECGKDIMDDLIGRAELLRDE